MYIFIWKHGNMDFFIKAFVYETSWHYDWETNAYRVGGSSIVLSGTKLASFFSGDTE